MPRKARILVPNCPHHIVQRGHNRNAVFIADEDYQYYLDNLLEWKQKLDIKVHAYCLMTNHVHLILDPTGKATNISLLMKRLAGRQAAYVNKLERRTGSLWEGRFKASPVQRDDYLMACCRYVDLNPVKANMVPKPEVYKWSSYRERVGQPVLRRLVDDYQTAVEQKNYEAYVRSGYDVNEMKLISDAINSNQLTGNNRFIEEIESRIGIRVENRGRGRPCRASR